jgi:hypothetical protein
MELAVTGMCSAIKNDNLECFVSFSQPKFKTNDLSIAQHQLSQYLNGFAKYTLPQLTNPDEIIGGQIGYDYLVYQLILRFGNGEDALRYLNNQTFSPYLPVSPLMAITISSFVHIISTPDLLLQMFKAGGSLLEFLAKLALGVERRFHLEEQDKLMEQDLLAEKIEKEKKAKEEQTRHLIHSQARAPLWQQALKSIVARSEVKAAKAIHHEKNHVTHEEKSSHHDDSKHHHPKDKKAKAEKPLKSLGEKISKKATYFGKFKAASTSSKGVTSKSDPNDLKNVYISPKMARYLLGKHLPMAKEHHEEIRQEEPVAKMS